VELRTELGYYKTAQTRPRSRSDCTSLIQWHINDRFEHNRETDLILSMFKLARDWVFRNITGSESPRYQPGSHRLRDLIVTFRQFEDPTSATKESLDSAAKAQELVSVNLSLECQIAEYPPGDHRHPGRRRPVRILRRWRRTAV